MMKSISEPPFGKVLVFALVFLAFSQAITWPQTNEAFPFWATPTARDKAKTPFNPKPTTGNNIFKGDGEKWLADAIIKVEAGTLTRIKDKDVSEYVSLVGSNLVKYSRAPSDTFEFIVLADRREDAFSIGAGRIYITVGMLMALSSEDELAAVLAHEIGHNAFKHAPKTVTRQLFWMKGVTKINSANDAEKALRELDEAYKKNMFTTVGESLLGWSRNDELQADKAGFYNVYKAGYNPEAMKNFLRRDVRHSKEELGEDYDLYQFLTFLFGSHPPSSDRVTALKWESNWVKMPSKDESYKNSAFDAMKAHVAKM